MNAAIETKCARPGALRRTLRASLVAAAAGLALASPAHAQLAVYDALSYVKLIEQATTALQQLTQLKAQVDQAEQLFTSLNTPSGVAALASQLAAPELRQIVPQASALSAGASGNFTALGGLGARANTLREAARLYTPPPGDTVAAEQELNARRAALDQALGQTVADTGAVRLQGLQTLSASIDGATNARAVLDLQARLSAEAAMAANDQLRMQGLAMAQAAEDRLAPQRERERAAAAREARMALYRRTFQ